MAFTELNAISTAEMAYYVPAGAVACFLAARHGFRRNSGWIFLVIFSLARIIGSALQLATISQPKNTGLFVGWAILQIIGLSPLMLMQVALLNRALSSIRKSRGAIISPRILRLVQLLILVSLILSTTGGTQSGQNYPTTGVYTQSTLAKAGTTLIIVSYIILVLATAFTALHLSRIEKGERRVVLAMGLSLPLILVRLVYAAVSVFANNPDFNPVTGNPHIILGVAVIEEMIVVAIVEAIGLTLKAVPKEQIAEGSGRLRRPRAPRVPRRQGRFDYASVDAVETGYEIPVPMVQKPSTGRHHA
ncbi:hypothetical protein F4780DRAFT_735447 [Xylariomycetidae sp. FL0641]|nr:hypothetical protein F4780DRAFT_735447 [Xylariomycetidae sp. FL0641]